MTRTANKNAANRICASPYLRPWLGHDGPINGHEPRGPNSGPVQWTCLKIGPSHYGPNSGQRSIGHAQKLDIENRSNYGTVPIGQVLKKDTAVMVQKQDSGVQKMDLEGRLSLQGKAS